MAITDHLLRPLAAGIFVVGGFDAVRQPGARAEKAEKFAASLGPSTGLTGEQLVRINGAVHVAAGLALATGRLPRPAAAVLAASLVPTTLAGHRFWEETTPDAKKMQRTQFLKNLSILGGLLSIATNTGGRPSIPWRARRAITSAVDTSVDTVHKLIPASD